MIALALIALVTGGPEPTVVNASADDCAITVEIGRARAAWGPKGPNQLFVIEGQGPEGSVYRQDCDWVALGVGAPVLAKIGKPGPRFAVKRPVYGVGRKTAEATVTFVAWAGPGSTPLISIEHCRLRSRRGVWHLVKCEQGLIT